MVLVVVLVEGLALLLAAVTANGGHVDEAVSELDEGTPGGEGGGGLGPLDRDVEVRNVQQAEVDESLQVVLAKVGLDALWVRGEGVL